MNTVSSPNTPLRPTPLAAVLSLTALASVGTGVFWNGMPFVAKHDYRYDEHANFLLFTVLGIVYLCTAMTAGRTVRALERIVSARTLMALILFSQAAVCVGPLIFDRPWIVLPVTVFVMWTSAYLWPIVESYLSAGRAGARLRFSIGIWNVVWTSAVALALLGMAPLLVEGERFARYAIVGLGGVNLLAVIALLWFNRNPLQPGQEPSDAEVGPQYAYLLHAARILLPVGYLLMGMITPLLPYRLEALDVMGELNTPVAATWMFARVAAIAFMWRIPFWHGRWGTLLLGGCGMTIGFLLVILAPTLPMMFAGLALFGCAQGVVYYAAIYYAMSVGNAHVDAAGIHEGLIGVGYAAGPALGLFTLWIAGDEDIIALSRIALVCVAMIVAAAFAVRPYLASRRSSA